MSIRDELEREGYKFQYEHGGNEDRTEVWINPVTKMAIRIEWFRVEDEPTCDRFS
jgi:hypothetical protein